MIARLVLERFGKFKDASFEFGPVTLFYGPNEAGKTTVFDALAKAICVSRGKMPGMERYGPQASARAEFTDGGELSFDHTEFFNIYAVRSNSIEFPIEGDAKWMVRVRNSFFSGGLDPESMAREIEKSLNARGRKADEEGRRKAVDAARDRAERASASLAEAEAARDRARETGRLLSSAREAVKRLAESSEALRGRSEASAARARLSELRRWLALVERWRTLTARKHMPDEAQKARALKEGLDSALRAEDAAGEAERIARERLASLRERRSALDEEARLSERLGKSARELADWLEPFSIPRELRERRAGMGSFIGLGGSALAGILTGIILFAAGAHWALCLIAPLAGIALGLGLFMALRKTHSRIDDSHSLAAAEKARAEWLRAFPKAPGLAGPGARETLAALRAIQSEADLKTAAAEEARREESRAEAAYRAAKSDAEIRAAASSNRRAEWAAFLADRGAASYEEYLSLVSEAASRAREADAMGAEIMAEASAMGAAGMDDFVARLRHQAEGIERAWPEAGEAPRGNQVLESERLREAEAALAAARAEEARLQGAFERESALAEKDRLALMAECAQAREEARAAAEAARADALLRSAEGIARELFLDMASDSDIAFRGLSELVTAYYGSAVGEERACVLPSLSMTDSLVPDSGGQARPPAHLSLGTRDLFVLACRLALAQSMGRERAVLVFDEAFKNLDRDRCPRALAMIEEFRNRTGWQLVFLTKDAGTADAAAQAFPSGAMIRYDLQPSGPQPNA